MRAYKSGYPAGSALDKTLAEQYVHLSDSRRRADRVIWAGLGRIPDPKTDVPAIVVDFVFNRLRDRVRDHQEKRRQYLAIGIQEHWIIDRFERIMTVFRGRTEQPAEQIVKQNEVYRTRLLAGFELPLAWLLKVADDWAGPARAGKKGSGAEVQHPRDECQARYGFTCLRCSPPDWSPGRQAINSGIACSAGFWG